MWVSKGGSHPKILFQYLLIEPYCNSISISQSWKHLLQHLITSLQHEQTTDRTKIMLNTHWNYIFCQWGCLWWHYYDSCEIIETGCWTPAWNRHVLTHCKRANYVSFESRRQPTASGKLLTPAESDHTATNSIYQHLKWWLLRTISLNIIPALFES